MQQLITTQEAGDLATAEDVLSHVRFVDELRKQVLTDGVHYGKIPGCGDKPALLKPGAEKITLAFRLHPRFEVKRETYENGHREYEVVCRLYFGDRIVGEGIGVASTLENKYRYRWDNTQCPVPPEYWETRNAEILGGPQYRPRKIGDRWLVFQRVEHDNPADYYNTAAKMAKKRAHVDAVLTTTAASDIFDQDIDDDPNLVPPAANPGSSAPVDSGAAGLATEAQLNLIEAKLRQAGRKMDELREALGLDEGSAIAFDQVNKALAWIKDNAKA